MLRHRGVSCLRSRGACGQEEVVLDQAKGSEDDDALFDLINMFVVWFLARTQLFLFFCCLANFFKLRLGQGRTFVCFVFFFCCQVFCLMLIHRVFSAELLLLLECVTMQTQPTEGLARTEKKIKLMPQFHSSPKLFHSKISPFTLSCWKRLKTMQSLSQAWGGAGSLLRTPGAQRN